MKIFNLHIITDKQYRDKMERCAINGYGLGVTSAKRVINPALHGLERLITQKHKLSKESVRRIYQWLKDYVEESKDD